MNDKKQDRFIIVGGGIGGLAAALGLAQHGIKSIVLEKSSKLGEIGAGIQLGLMHFMVLTIWVLVIRLGKCLFILMI